MAVVAVVTKERGDVYSTVDIRLLKCRWSANTREQSVPNCLPVIEDGMNEDRSHACKPQSVRKRRRRGKINWGVVIISRFIQRIVRVHNQGRVIWLPCIIKVPGRGKRQVHALPYITPMQSRGDDPEEEDAAAEHVYQCP